MQLKKNEITTIYQSTIGLKLMFKPIISSSHFFRLNFNFFCLYKGKPAANSLLAITHYNTLYRSLATFSGLHSSCPKIRLTTKNVNVLKITYHD